MPHLFHSKVWQAIHTDPNTGESDLIEGCYPYLDDIPIVTPRLQTDEATVARHYEVLDKVCYRLHYHGFKISGEKMEPFRTEASILGHKLSHDKIQIDPKRIDKMVRAPFPTSKKGAQVWCGFLSSIKYFSPPELSKLHAVISPLTSCKAEFAVKEHHTLAFKRIKEILTSHDFVVAVPNPTKAKLLYVDSSQLLAAAILFEVEFDDDIVIIPGGRSDTDKRNFARGDKIGEMAKRYSLNLELSSHTPADGNCFYHALVDQVSQLGMKNFPHTIEDMRAAVVSTIENSDLLVPAKSLVQEEGKTWEEFVRIHSNPGIPTDDKGIIVHGAAKYLDRRILLASYSNDGTECVTSIMPSQTSANKPPVWMAFYPGAQGTVGHFQSLLCISPNRHTKFTSFEEVQDNTQLTQQQLFDKVKKCLNDKGKTPYKVKVVSYFSKVVAQEDRHRAIYELEAQALISSLHHLKHYITLAPVVVTVVDSRTAYFLFSPGIYRSALKVRRWNLLLQAEYPNVLLMLVGTKDNWSDILTRTFDLPEPVEDQIQLKNMTLDNVPELADRIMSFKDILNEAGNLPDKRCVTTPEKTETHIQSLTLETINDFTSPVDILGDRLSGVNMVTAQNRSLASKDSLGYTPKEGLWISKGLVVWGKEAATVVPKGMEGLAIAYVHLITGHTGDQKLVEATRKLFYFPLLSKLAKRFARQCVTCSIHNKLTGPKGPLGRIPLPNAPFEAVFMDLLETLPGNQQNINHLLVISDYLSKNVYTYPLRAKSAVEVLRHVQTFIMHTGGCTRYIYTDNATVFRENNFVTYISNLGIILPKTTPHSSKSRGAVEIQNKLLTILMSKLIHLSPRYNFQDVHFLAAMLLNNSFNAKIKASPVSVIYGRDPVQQGPWGLNATDPPLTSRLLDVSLKQKVKALRQVTDKKLQDLRKELESIRSKQERKAARSSMMEIDYTEGDLVFVRNFTKPAPGKNVKFRPVLYKSPFVVVSQAKRAVTCMRLVDGVVMQVHKDYIRKYRPMDPIFDSLPNEVKRIVGQPISDMSLRALAEQDALEPIFLDRLPPASRPDTRTTRNRRLELEAAVDALESGQQDIDISSAADFNHNNHLQTPPLSILQSGERRAASSGDPAEHIRDKGDQLAQIQRPNNSLNKRVRFADL